MSENFLCPICGERLLPLGGESSVQCPKCGPTRTSKSSVFVPVATATLLEKVETPKGSGIRGFAEVLKAVVWLNCVVTCMQAKNNGGTYASFSRAVQRNDYVSGQSTFRAEDVLTFGFEIVSLFAVSYAICALVDAVAQILRCIFAK